MTTVSLLKVQPVTFPSFIERATFLDAIRSLGVQTRGLIRIESDPLSVTLTYREHVSPSVTIAIR